MRLNMLDESFDIFFLDYKGKNTIKYYNIPRIPNRKVTKSQ